VVAAEQGHAHVVKALLEHGARPTRAAGNGATPLFVAAKNGHSEVP
jgi:ankyrin repeat protein